MSRGSPLGVFCGGLVAGFLGAIAQNLFFASTKRIAPGPATQAFEPPEPEQASETTTLTVARRVTEHLARRGPLEHEKQAAQLVHLAFGSAWGALYGLAAASGARPRLLKSGLAFGTTVWLVSDNILLPAFRLSAWPHHYPVKTHLYALAAHAVYGVTVASGYAAWERSTRPAMVALGAFWLTRRVPQLMRPTARRWARTGLRAALPVRSVWLALS
jgi:uncharacterized membrane protein YagU involved in acid resistance